MLLQPVPAAPTNSRRMALVEMLCALDMPTLARSRCSRYPGHRGRGLTDVCEEYEFCFAWLSLIAHESLHPCTQHLSADWHHIQSAPAASVLASSETDTAKCGATEEEDSRRCGSSITRICVPAQGRVSIWRSSPQGQIYFQDRECEMARRSKLCTESKRCLRALLPQRPAIRWASAGKRQQRQWGHTCTWPSSAVPTTERSALAPRGVAASMGREGCSASNTLSAWPSPYLGFALHLH